MHVLFIVFFQKKKIHIIPHKNEGKTNPSRPQLLLNCPVQFGKSENKVWLCLSSPCLKKLLHLKQYQRLQGTQENHNSWQKFQFSWHKAINSAEKSDSNCNWLRVDKETRSANLKENLQTGKAMSDKGTKDSCTWWGLIQGKKKKRKEWINNICTLTRDIFRVITLSPFVSRSIKVCSQKNGLCHTPKLTLLAQS